MSYDKTNIIQIRCIYSLEKLVRTTTQKLTNCNKTASNIETAKNRRTTNSLVIRFVIGTTSGCIKPFLPVQFPVILLAVCVMFSDNPRHNLLRTCCCTCRPFCTCRCGTCRGCPCSCHDCHGRTFPCCLRIWSSRDHSCSSRHGPFSGHNGPSVGRNKHMVSRGVFRGDIGTYPSPWRRIRPRTAVGALDG